MAGIAAAIIGAGALGAGASVFGALTQKGATNKAIQAQQAMFAQAQAANQPFITAGQGAASTLSDLLKPGNDMSAILKGIPGFMFLQDITQQGVANQATTTGLSGNTLLAGANAGNNIALSAGWSPIVNALQGLTNTGAGSAASLSGAALGTGQGIAGSLIGGGNAIAAGTMGAANSIGNSLTTASLFSKLLNQGNGMYATAADAGKGAAGDFGSGGYNFLDAAAG